jgi:antitoxin ParD1/3/4
MATMNVSLPKKMKDWVESRVAEGTYANASDYVRDLVRRDQRRTEGIARLQAEIDKGRASGISDKTLDQIFEEARARAVAAVKTRDAAA